MWTQVFVALSKFRRRHVRINHVETGQPEAVGHKRLPKRKHVH